MRADHLRRLWVLAEKTDTILRCRYRGPVYVRFEKHERAENMAVVSLAGILETVTSDGDPEGWEYYSDGDGQSLQCPVFETNDGEEVSIREVAERADLASDYEDLIALYCAEGE